MNSDELTAAVIKAGLDTPEKVTAAFATFVTQSEIRTVEAQIEALNQKRADALVPFDQERVQLNGQRASLLNQINATP